MSSFKRKSTSKSTQYASGTRSSPSSTSTLITSTGIPSLDDILGGGLPLSCSLAVLAPDLHSAYGDLVQKYFIAQGIACGHTVLIIDDDAERLVRECMWTNSGSAPITQVEQDGQPSEKIKIAWRYEQMKQFETTVESSTSSADNYCSAFDLSCRIPETVVRDAVLSKQVITIAVSSCDQTASATHVLQRLRDFFQQQTASANTVRICIPTLGSSQWGELTAESVCYFLHSLRALLRRHPRGCASFSLSPEICTDESRGLGWTQKVAWVSDAAITLSAFTANPSLSATFPAHHGLFGILALPAPQTLIPASDKFSTLRGISLSSGSTGGGENNLAFKCTRKRLVFETLHLDLEGGVGERRTTPSTSALTSELGSNTGADALRAHSHPALAEMRVEIESSSPPAVPAMNLEPLSQIALMSAKPKKPRKKVQFHSDRPELYDF